MALVKQSRYDAMDDNEQDEDVGSMSSLFDSDEENSSEQELEDDATSSSSSMFTDDQIEQGSIMEMSSLMEVLPFKRGLSKHYEGRSQSFTSLANAQCLADLVKPEKPCNKKLKSSKSYSGALDKSKVVSFGAASKTICKKTTRECLSSLHSRRHSLLMNKSPVRPQRSSCLSSQTMLIA